MDQPRLKSDFDDFMRGHTPLYQLKRYLIGEKDEAVSRLLAENIVEMFRKQLLEGVYKDDKK